MARGNAVKRSPARGEIAVALAGLLAALLLRAVFLASLRENYDFTSWRIVVDILHRGGELYRETGRYNYSPLWAGILVGLDALGRFLGLSLPRLISLFLLCVDLATAGLLCAIALQRGRTMSRALISALLFLANPISIIVSSFRGMFDNLSIFFLLLALFYAGKKPAMAKASTVGALALSLVAKHVTWFHPLLFARRRENARLSWPAALSSYGFFLLSFAPFWRQWEGIRAHVFGYRGLDETYGTEPLRFILWLPRETTTVLFVLAALASVALMGRVELGRACLMLMLVVLIFTPGVCPTTSSGPSRWAPCIRLSGISSTPSSSPDSSSTRRTCSASRSLICQAGGACGGL